MHNAQLSLALDLGAHGGAEIFFADINGDGVKEIIAYQGPGVFGARMYGAKPQIKPFLPEHTSVSAFDLRGKRLWTWGEPNPPDRPYAAHSAESCVSAADIDGDGRVEVVVALGDAVVALEGVTGREKYSASMPEDYFYILHALRGSTGRDEAAVAVKNGELDYRDGPYGQPVLGLDGGLRQVWVPKYIPGGGHHILTVPLPDGRPGFLIGYCAVHPAGHTVWRADAIDPQKLDAYNQHVDLCDCWQNDAGDRFYALACGTNQGHVIADGGQTVFSMSGDHIQGVAAGRFLGGREHQAAFYDCRQNMISLYNLAGNCIWRKRSPRLDQEMTPLDLTRPGGGQHHFHRNRPLVTIQGAERDWIGYADGGWPWGMDGGGDIALQFPTPMGLPQAPWVNYPEMAHLRPDDIGCGYALQNAALEPGQPLAIIYNRRYVWGYDLNFASRKFGAGRGARGAAV